MEMKLIFGYLLKHYELKPLDKKVCYIENGLLEFEDDNLVKFEKMNWILKLNLYNLCYRDNIK